MEGTEAPQHEARGTIKSMEPASEQQPRHKGSCALPITRGELGQGIHAGELGCCSLKAYRLSTQYEENGWEQHAVREERQGQETEGTI